MAPNSITINYKSKQFTLDRVSAEGKYHQIGFEAKNWGVRISLLKNGSIRVIIEKSIKRSEDGLHTQFYWACSCVLFRGKLILGGVYDPATCKPVSRKTRLFIIEPMIREIYTQLKAEIDALHSGVE
jgi:hypothetical protein